MASRLYPSMCVRALLDMLESTFLAVPICQKWLSQLLLHVRDGFWYCRLGGGLEHPISATIRTHSLTDTSTNGRDLLHTFIAFNTSLIYITHSPDFISQQQVCWAWGRGFHAGICNIPEGLSHTKGCRPRSLPSLQNTLRCRRTIGQGRRLDWEKPGQNGRAKTKD